MVATSRKWLQAD